VVILPVLKPVNINSKKPGGISDRSALYDTEEISAGIDW